MGLVPHAERVTRMVPAFRQWVGTTREIVTGLSVGEAHRKLSSHSHVWLGMLITWVDDARQAAGVAVV